MHIEPGLVEPAKLALGYATGTAALGYAASLAWNAARTDGVPALLLRTLIATALVLFCFEVLPHRPIGVSEVHLILGSTLLLLVGPGPAAIGLAAGLLVQGAMLTPTDLPQYGMNVTTLLVPLFAAAGLARRIIPARTPYVDIGYGQALRLSLAYQGGIVLWVAFWALYGAGAGAENVDAIGRFGVAYFGVVLLEPLVDLGVLALARRAHRLQGTAAMHRRLHHAG